MHVSRKRPFIAAISLVVVLCAAARALTQAPKPQPPITADLHEQMGVACEDCHPNGDYEAVDMEDACLSCHGPYGKVARITDGPCNNPHVSHMIGMECNECHSGHEPSKDACADCHDPHSLSDTHIASGVGCSACHEKNSEGTSQADAPSDRCLECHGPLAQLAAMTMELDLNPHISHIPDLQCTDCHHAHREQENACLACH
jgi:fumarate reductase flavoprotein subunit